LLKRSWGSKRVVKDDFRACFILHLPLL